MDVEPKPPIQYCELRDFRFQDGTVLPVARLAYLDINPAASRVALIPTCFRGRLHTTLSFAAAEKGALRDYRVIVVALFGNGESSSPSNTQPADSFPRTLDYRDCVRAQHALLTQHLGLTAGVDVVVGFSMAGQCAYYWAATYPRLIRYGVVVICSSARTSGHNYQFLEGPKTALENAADPTKGIRAFAKAYSAWLTSADWFENECWRQLGYSSHAEWDEDSTGPKYSGWQGADLLAKLRMWQHGNVSVCFDSESSSSPSRTSLGGALARIEVPVLLMPCNSDQYFRHEASAREAAALKRSTLAVIDSVWGHLAGNGADPASTAWMNEQIAAFLKDDGDK